MNKPAAFSATYSNWKVIQGRKVVQIVFEVPLEKADEAYQALGGMPDNSVSTWCAIAKLDPEKLQTEDGGVPDFLRRTREAS